MKSFYSFVLIFGILLSNALALTPEEKHEAEKKILDECKGSVGATNNDVNSILERKTPTEYKGKCLLKCAHEKIGLIQDGKFSIDSFKAFGEKELGNDMKAVGVFNEMLDACKSITDPDLCEASAKMMDCMIKEGLKRGVDPKKGIKESIASN
ncbi:general odorant-binding protein 19d-like [Contarinia nasturtii]|uniref:general odorant-binding protein 19d-like n=1 Tax=Contarinia nasturtii TaxID=265458 RepID=UPI0012D4AC47|nr:general odorant-binding protein 19d-like [Contarinia nasturtii]